MLHLIPFKQSWIILFYLFAILMNWKVYIFHHYLFLWCCYYLFLWSCHKWLFRGRNSYWWFAIRSLCFSTCASPFFTVHFVYYLFLTIMPMQYRCSFFLFFIYVFFHRCFCWFYISWLLHVIVLLVYHFLLCMIII